MNNQTKKCVSCKALKTPSDFSKRSSTKDGLRDECRSCNNAYRNAWRAKNKNREAVNKSVWAKNNRAVCNAQNAKRRAMLREAITSTTCLKTVKDIYTQCPKGYDVDHKIPLNKGGKHHQNNLCFITKSLNYSKSDKLLSEHPELKKRFDAEVIYPTY